MPMPGDQHRETAATTNPFLERKPHITEYAAQEIATLQRRLDQQLGPEYISTRPGNGGGKVHYLAAEKVINLANEVFGFNGWSSTIVSVQIDFVDENVQTGKVSLGLSVVVRVTLKDGAHHEDIGYGHIENCKGKAAAFEKAKKEGVTDALKRALRNFGNLLGNCLYDKDYLQKVAKIKVVPAKWTADNLHRHPDYAPIKEESMSDAEIQEKQAAARRQISAQSGASLGSGDNEDDFGGTLFDETDFSHPDEVVLNDTPVQRGTVRAPNGQQQPRQSVPRMQSMPHLATSNVHGAQKAQQPPPAQTHRPHPPPLQQRPGNTNMASGPNHFDGPRNYADPSNISLPKQISTNHAPQQRPSVGPDPSREHADEQDVAAPRVPPPGAPEGFVTGRNADLLNQPANARPPNNAMAFNPHADSPSIRKTHGVNPGKSVPITRSALNALAHNTPTTPASALSTAAPAVPQQQIPAGASTVTTPVRTNYVNPSADANRRIGMPPAAASMSANRGAYRPPVPQKRPPLSDISNLQQLDGAGDTKKVKVDELAEADSKDGAAPAAEAM